MKSSSSFRGARRLVIAALAAFAALPLTAGAQGADKPYTVIVPFPPGGPLDAAARVLAEAVRPALGNVLVENRSGAGGNIGMSVVAKAEPDGHTLGIGALSTHAINPWLYKNMPFDPIKDFVPITLVTNLPNVLVLNKEFAEKNKIDSVAAFVDYLKANPGKVNFGSGGNGSGGHLAAELFKQFTGVDMVHIPYRGAAPAQTALLAGEVQLMFDNLGSASARIRDGSIKAIAVTTAKRSPSLPDMPTLSESGVQGLKGIDVSTWFGIFVPAGTPPAMVQKLNKAFTDALKSPTVADRLSRMGAVPAPTTSAEFAELIQRENKRYEEVVKRSGARLD